MKSGFVWPPSASAAFAPIEVPLLNNWSAIFLAAGPPFQSRSHSFTIRQANSKARSEMILDGMVGCRSKIGPFQIPRLS